MTPSDKSACAVCSLPLADDSASMDFCGPHCQFLWQSKQAHLLPCSMRETREHRERMEALTEAASGWVVPDFDGEEIWPTLAPTPPTSPLASTWYVRLREHWSDALRVRGRRR